MIEISSGIIYSKTILEVIKPSLEKSKQWFSVSSYSNGREDGYKITSSKKCVVFGNDRNSDKIVLYYGNFAQFDLNGVPDGYVYDGALYYNPDEIKAISRHIESFFGVR